MHVLAETGNTPNRGGTTDKTQDNPQVFKTPAANSAAVGQNADLALVNDRWLSLPEHIRLAVMTLVKAGG